MNPHFLRYVRAVSAAAILALAAAPRLSAQGTATVAPSDLAYADIDRLSQLGVLDSVIMGQRPYSRREIARIARIAADRLELRGAHFSTYAGELVQRLRARFPEGDGRARDEWLLSPIDGASLTAATTDAERRAFLSLANKSTEATIDPLAERRLGQPAVRGSTLALEVAQRVEPTSWLAIQARERIEARSPRDTGISSTQGEVLLASARARFRNLALTVGRQQVTWAQDAGGGIVLASDAPALDQISITGDQPFILPGFLHLLGPTQGTLLLADLGPSVSHAHSRLLAYKVSVQPSSILELGASFENHYGGAGSRSSSVSDRLIDFLWFFDIFRHHNYTDTSKSLDVESDKVLAADGRLRIAPLGGLVVTGEMLIDDFDVHRIPQLLTGYGSQTVGLSWPVLVSPELSLKLTAKHLGIITYTHAQLTDGMTSRGRLLGDELGPDSKSFGALLGWTPTAAARFELEGRSAIYSNAAYAGFYPDTSSSKYVVKKLSSLPNELRDILIGGLTLQDNSGLALTARAGMERIRNVSSGRRRDYVAQLALRYGL
ncbi:MAG: Capsule assembly protein Wzi [Gemmatimonadetes bacterium]|nr:Capsule assembly protein Wzi [Gemmatimonadota bacterium]